ncbi:MAG: hypothetical protein WC587_03840 [Candidatus Paceibacterota bacterium]
MESLENIGKIEKREHTDPELLEAKDELEKGNDESLRKIVKETLEKDPLYDTFSEKEEKEKEEIVERNVNYLKDINKKSL